MGTGQRIGLIALGVVCLAVGVTMFLVARTKRADRIARETIGELRYGGRSAYSTTGFLAGGVAFGALGLICVLGGIFG